MPSLLWMRGGSIPWLDIETLGRGSERSGVRSRRWRLVHRRGDGGAGSMGTRIAKCGRLPSRRHVRR